MSRPNNPWLQFHKNNHPPTVQVQTTDHLTSVVTSPNPSGSSQLNRVTRPTIARKRSRASKKTPTTLLNTDTTNFRAMVQRFTGGGSSSADVTSAPYTSHEYPVTSSTHDQVFNTYNNSTSSFGFSDGFGRVSYNNEPYFTMMGDSSGTTTAAAYEDDDGGGDQHMGFRQSGPFNW